MILPAITALAEGGQEIPVVDPSSAGSLALPLVLVIALPALGAALLLLGGRRTDAFGHLVGCATVVGSFVCSLWLFIALALIFAFMLLSGFASFWTERLWFASVGYRGVFTTLLLTRIGLFLVFAGLMAATVALAVGLSRTPPPPGSEHLHGAPASGVSDVRTATGVSTARTSVL